MRKGTWVTVSVLGSAVLIALLCIPAALRHAAEPWYQGRWSVGDTVAITLVWLAILGGLIAHAIWSDRHAPVYSPSALVQPRFGMAAYVTFGVIAAFLLLITSPLMVMSTAWGMPLFIATFMVVIVMFLLFYRPVTVIDPEAKMVTVGYGDPRPLYAKRIPFDKVEHAQAVHIRTNYGTYYWAALIVPGSRVLVTRCPTPEHAQAECARLDRMIGRAPAQPAPGLPTVDEMKRAAEERERDRASRVPMAPPNLDVNASLARVRAGQPVELSDDVVRLLLASSETNELLLALLALRGRMSHAWLPLVTPLTASDFAPEVQQAANHRRGEVLHADKIKKRS